MSDSTLSRRGFLKRAGIGLAGAGAMLEATWSAAQEAAPEPEARNQRDTMRYRVLGRTNLLVSELSMGGQFLTSAVLGSALDAGVNLLHLSVEYPGAFDGAAPVLKDRRKEVFLALKGRPGGAWYEFDEWLNALNTDHADFIFHPTISADEARDTNGRIRGQFDKLRQAGKARFLGLTCHNNVVEVSRAGVEAGHWDAIMPRYGAALRQPLQPIITQAAQKRIGVIAMKSLQAAGGRRNWTTAFQTALDHPGLTTVLKGLPNFELLEQLSAAVMERPTEEARRELERYVAEHRSSTCAMCSACAGCPQGVAIEDTLRCAFYYGEELGQHDYARHVYASLPRERTVLACADCGHCEAVCSHRLAVRQMLHKAHAMLA